VNLSKLIEEEIQMRKYGAFPKDYGEQEAEPRGWGNHKEVLAEISRSLAECNHVTNNLVCVW
jgi:hypothetical protein